MFRKERAVLHTEGIATSLDSSLIQKYPKVVQNGKSKVLCLCNDVSVHADFSRIWHMHFSCIDVAMDNTAVLIETRLLHESMLLC